MPEYVDLVHKFDFLTKTKWAEQLASLKHSWATYNDQSRATGAGKMSKIHWPADYVEALTKCFGKTTLATSTSVGRAAGMGPIALASTLAGNPAASGALCVFFFFFFFFFFLRVCIKSA